MKSIDFARDDSDLYPVLQQATLVEKAFLAEIIASKHSSSIDRKERDALKLAIELQSMGGDSLMNLFRRRGVNYREIVIDVAGKVGVKIDSQGDIMKMEELIAERVIEGYKEKLSEKELNSKLKRKIKIRIIHDIQSVQNISKYIKDCYLIAAGIIYIPLFVSNSFINELFLSLSLLLFGTLILGAFFHAILFLYIYFKNRNKVKNSYQHYLEPHKNKEILINIIRTIDSKSRM